MSKISEEFRKEVEEGFRNSFFITLMRVLGRGLVISLVLYIFYNLFF